MSFFRNLGNLFGLGGTTRALAQTTMSVARGAATARQQNIQAAAGYLPTTRATGSEDYLLFRGGALQNATSDALQSMFVESTGETILSPGQAGFEDQRARIGAFAKESQKELSAFQKEATAGIESQKYQRLINQTGGVRGGVARNPFNMNMLRGPQMNGAPARQAPAGATGGGGPAGQRASQYMMR